MKLEDRLHRHLSDPLKTFKEFECLIAALCISIPIILRLADKDQNGFRDSISNYVYMQHSYVFGMLLCIAAMLFIFNGAVYFKNARQFGLNPQGKWYNVVLGLSLLLVIVFPHLEYPIPHYFFALLFFVGNAIVTGIYHKKNNRGISIILAILTLASFALTLGHIISLFWAEWISLTVIGIHFILQTRGILAFITINDVVIPEKQAVN
jgi:hypothetical protein